MNNFFKFQNFIFLKNKLADSVEKKTDNNQILGFDKHFGYTLHVIILYRTCSKIYSCL